MAFPRNSIIDVPAGIDIGAQTPAEIALSILASVTAVRRGSTLRRSTPARTPRSRSGPSSRAGPRCRSDLRDDRRRRREHALGRARRRDLRLLLSARDAAPGSNSSPPRRCREPRRAAGDAADEIRALVPDIETLARRLADVDYLVDEGLATSMFLSLRLPQPLLLEGEAGVGKTEAAKSLALVLETPLVRLSVTGDRCGRALYEWNYPRQLLQRPARRLA